MAPIVFLLLLSIINPSLELDAISFARNHLKAFGYLSVDYTSLDDTNDEALVSALRTYQTFYRLNVTGRLEPDTLTSMTRPRCGVPDFPSKDPAHNITPQYSLLPGNPSHPPHRRRLTYAISTPEIVPEDSLRAALSSAFSKWSAETRFKFHEDYRVRDPDIHIGFYTRDHGDRNPFDGPRGILAHASPPRIDGLFHYDGDEQWSVNPSADQYDLESVALHEIGHLLGLGHSAVPSAVMFASFSRGDIKRVLQPDDIEGIRALYPQG